MLDFGIAKALSLSRKVTRNDFGSVAYLSPERLETGEVDAHADFWAVGVLAVRDAARRAAVPGGRHAAARAADPSRQPPPPLTGTCPAGLQAIVAKLLAPDADGALRQRATAIREDLEQAVRRTADRAGAGGLAGPRPRMRPPRAGRGRRTRWTTPRTATRARRDRGDGPQPAGRAAGRQYPPAVAAAGCQNDGGHAGSEAALLRARC